MDIQSNVLENIIQDMGYRIVAGKEIHLYKSPSEGVARDCSGVPLSTDSPFKHQESSSANANNPDTPGADSSEGLSFTLSGLSLQLLNANSSNSKKTGSSSLKQKSGLAGGQERDSIDSLPPVPLMSVELEDVVDTPSSSLFSGLLSTVSDSSYATLPQYLTTQITNAYLNDCVGEINDLLTDKRYAFRTPPIYRVTNGIDLWKTIK